MAQTTDGTGAVVSWRAYGATGAVVASSSLGELPVYGIKGSNGRSGKGPMPSFDDAVRAAIARQHLLRYCGNDDNVLNDLLEESLEQREGLHAGLAIAGLFVPIIADLFEAGMYSAEGDDAAAAAAFAFAAIDAVTAGVGGSVAKIALKGSKVVDALRGAGKAGTSFGQSIKFGSEAKSAERLARQMENRGWTEKSVRELVDNPYTTRRSVNKARGSSPATAYYDKEGHYVVIDDETKEVIQISDRIKEGWKPDGSIENPYVPKKEE